MGNPQESQLVFDWMRVMTKSQKQGYLISGLDGTGWVWPEERTHLGERAWVLFDPVKPDGMGAGRGLLVEKFPGDMKSASLFSVTMQLGHSGESISPLCASVFLSVNRNTHFPQLTFWK